MPKTIIYPSSIFEDEANALIDNRESFTVTVVDSSRRKMLIDHLPYLLDERDGRPVFWKTLYRQFVLLDFLSVYGSVIHASSYDVSLDTSDGLCIKFNQNGRTGISKKNNATH
jgi:hypothetical protein